MHSMRLHRIMIYKMSNIFWGFKVYPRLISAVYNFERVTSRFIEILNSTHKPLQTYPMWSHVHTAFIFLNQQPVKMGTCIFIINSKPQCCQTETFTKTFQKCFSANVIVSLKG